MTSTPVYHGMLSEIRQAIESGTLSDGQKIGTELEWSRKTGLSRVSVRRAIDVLVQEGLVERRAGKGLYITPDQIWTRQIQLVVPGLSDGQTQWARVAQGCRETCAENQAGMQIYDAAGSLDQDIRMIERLPESGMDGAVIAMLPHPKFSEAIYKLKNSRLPFVLVDDTLDQLDISSVMVDHYQGGYQVGEQLIKHGHRRIAFVGRMASRTVTQRIAGLRDAIADAGLPLDRGLLMDLEINDPLSNWQPSIDRCTRILMKSKEPPTAIFYASDDVAAHGYRTLKNLGLRIPEDISVVGFDGAQICQWLEPTLATMNQPCQEMGSKAVQILLAMLSGKPADQTQQIILPPTWINGGSLAQVKAIPQ